MKKNLIQLTLILLTGSALCAAAAPGGDQNNGRGGRNRERLMKQFDKDGDGKLSESERAAAKEAMEARRSRADTDGDGKVSEAERKAAHEKRLERFDGDGKISKQERAAARKKKGQCSE